MIDDELDQADVPATDPVEAPDDGVDVPFDGLEDVEPLPCDDCGRTDGTHDPDVEH
jgi:hypothetical protein